MKLESSRWCCVMAVLAVISRCHSENVSDFDYTNVDIWTFEETDYDQWAHRAFQAICNQYDLVTKNGKLSCDDIRLGSKLFSEDNSFEEHDIVKRQVQEEEDVEGSGEPGIDEVSPIIANQTNQPEKLGEIPSSTLEAIVDSLQSVTVSQKTGEETKAHSANVSTSEELKTEPQSSTRKTDVQKSTTTSDIMSKLSSTLKNTDSTTIEPNENQKESEVPVEDTDKVSAYDEGIEETKQKEHIDEQQDANTEILKHPVAAVAVKGVEMSESEKILIHMEVSAENKVGESSADVTKASKDTTILIVLFVIVVVIGGAAFAYNKVKQRRSNRSSSNNANNGKAVNDVEQGTELKPLMKNAVSDPKLASSNETKSDEITEKS